MAQTRPSLNVVHGGTLANARDPRGPAPTEPPEPDHELGEETDLGQLPVLRHFEDRRSYPRIELRVPAMVVTADHKVLKMRTRNLSAEGVQLRSDRETAMALHPRGTHIPPGAGPVFNLRLELLVDGEVHPVILEARLDYITARDSTEIAFGAQFTRIRPGDKETLAAYIMESLRPREY